MKLGKIILATTLCLGLMQASEFINYKTLTSKLKKEAKEKGNFATTKELKEALAAKDWAVVDVRTIKEWQGGRIANSYRIGRQSPEKALESIVLDDDDKFIKDNLIVICNSASRASIEAQTLRQMGFKKVKIYPFYQWIDECNPVVTAYSTKKNKKGTKGKFGMYYAEHCKK